MREQCAKNFISGASECVKFALKKHAEVYE